MRTVPTKSNQFLSLRTLLLALALGSWLFSAHQVQAQLNPPTSNLQLWLKADAGITTNGSGGATAWADQSGAGRNAVLPGGVIAPTFLANVAELNNKPAVQFGVGATAYLQLTSTLDIPGDISSFVVVRLHPQAQNYRGIWDQGGPVNGYPYPNQWMIYNTGLSTLQRGDDTIPNYDDAFSSSPVPLNNYVALGFVAASTNVHFFKNNNADGADVISTARTTPAVGGVLIRIGDQHSGIYPLNGEVAELLIYDAALSDTDRSNLWIYLVNKYNLPRTLPVSLTTSPPNGSTIAASSGVVATANVATIGTLISRVDFYANSVKFASVSSQPYTVPLDVLNPGTLTLTAVALDNLGLSTASAPSVLTVTGATPTFTGNSSLKLWLKADAGVTTNGSGEVTTWADQSGNANNAGVGPFGLAPLFVNNAINGQPAIHLDNTALAQRYFDVPHSASLSSLTGDISAVIVMNVPASQFGNYRIPFCKGGDNGYPSPNALMLSPGGLPTMNRGTGTNMTQDLFPGTQAIPDAHYSIVFYNQAGTAMKQFLNAVPNGTQTAAVTPIDTDLGPLHIGTRGDFFSFLNADIAELMIFDSAVSGTNLDNLQNYLGTKYGLALAVQAPNTPPTVSITSPTDGSSVTPPADFTVIAAASDTDGNVAGVELFAGGVSLGAKTAPYRWPVHVNAAGQVILTVVATDNLGATNSATTTITSTGANTFTAGTNLVLWLKADAGITTNGNGGVTDWADQSAYGNNATAPLGTPTFIANAVNGRPALHFDNTLASYLTVTPSSSMAITGNIASFVVLSPNAANGGNYRFIWWTGNTYPGPNGFMMFPNNQPVPVRGDEATSQQDLFLGYRNVTAQQYSILSFSEAGNIMKQYLNTYANGTQTASKTPVDGGNPTYIGSRGDFYTYLRAEIAELMIFNSAMTGTNLDAVHAYLKTKYAIALVEPSRPPLSLAGQTNGTVVISWPLDYSGFALQSATNLPAASWTTVSGAVSNSVTVTPTGTQKYYRLQLAWP